MNLTEKHRKIYRNFQNKILNKDSASELLIILIENNQDDDLRVECIEFIRKIDLRSSIIFEFLENLLISDLNEAIRKAAFRAIEINFPQKAITPVRFAINREEGMFLISLIKFLAKVNPFLCREVLIDKIKKLDGISFTDSLNNRKIENLNFKKLKDIIFDYLFRKSLDALYFHRRKIPFAVDLNYID